MRVKATKWCVLWQTGECQVYDEHIRHHPWMGRDRLVGKEQHRSEGLKISPALYTKRRFAFPLPSSKFCVISTRGTEHRKLCCGLEVTGCESHRTEKEEGDPGEPFTLSHFFFTIFLARNCSLPFRCTCGGDGVFTFEGKLSDKVSKWYPCAMKHEWHVPVSSKSMKNVQDFGPQEATKWACVLVWVCVCVCTRFWVFLIRSHSFSRLPSNWWLSLWRHALGRFPSSFHLHDP